MYRPQTNKRIDFPLCYPGLKDAQHIVVYDENENRQHEI